MPTPRPDYARFLELVTKRNLGTETTADHDELDNDWLYSTTETYRVMFQIFIDRSFINPMQDLVDSMKTV